MVAEMSGQPREIGGLLFGCGFFSVALIPMGGADIIVSLEPMEALRYVQWLAPGGWIITNTVPFVNIIGLFQI